MHTRAMAGGLIKALGGLLTNFRGEVLVDVLVQLVPRN